MNNANWKIGSDASSSKYLRQNLFDNSCLQNSGQLLFQAVVQNKQLLMMQAEQMQDGGMPVGNTHAALYGRKPDFIRRAEGRARFNPGS